MEHNYNEELFQWLNRNEDASAIDKMDAIKKHLGEGHSYSMLEYKFQHGDIVELHINIAEYESEDYPEEVTYAVEVNTYHEENFKSIKEAYLYYKNRINELTK